MKLRLPPKSRQLAALSGLLFAAATPPFNFFILAWIGAIPLMLAINKPNRAGFGEGFTAGLVYNSIMVYWLAMNSGTVAIIATATAVACAGILAAGWGTACWIFGHFHKRFGEIAWLIMPFSWLAWEGLLNLLGDLSFPWPLIALTQTGFSPVLQIMEFTGVWAVSFWVILVNIGIYFTWLSANRYLKRLGLAIVIFCAITPAVAQWHAYGHDSDDLSKIDAMVVQGDIPPYEKWVAGENYSWTVYDSLSRAGAELFHPDLIIWPETAIPGYIMNQSGSYYRFAELSDELNAGILSGASDYRRVAGRTRQLNGAFLALPGEGITQRCAKRVLVPFGERVPYQAIFPSLGKLNFGQAEFLHGDRPVLFHMTIAEKEVNFPVMICFESAFPHVSRYAALQGANLLVTISNDAWYGKMNEAAQIVALSRFRSIEVRRAQARVSNTGISVMIDQLGRELIRTDWWEPAVAHAGLFLNDELTFYARHGDWFLLLCSLVYSVSLAYVLVRGRRKTER